MPLFDQLELDGFTWEENTDMQIEIQAMHIEILGTLQEIEHLRQVGKGSDRSAYHLEKQPAQSQTCSRSARSDAYATTLRVVSTKPSSMI